MSFAMIEEFFGLSSSASHGKRKPSGSEEQEDEKKKDEENAKRRKLQVFVSEEAEEGDDIELPIGVVEELYNQMRFGHLTSRVAWSSQNLIAWVPPKANSMIEILKPVRNPLSASNTSCGTWLYPQKASSSMSIQTEKYHTDNNISNVIFNQLGNVLASVDRTGMIVLWIMEEFVNEWKAVWNIDVKEPVVAFWWLATERKWEATETAYKRRAFKGPRNRFGHLAFVVVTSSGKILLCYQQERNKFLKSETQLDVRANSCITHADWLLNDEGRFILAAFDANSLSHVVTIFDISVDLLLLDDMNQKHQNNPPIQCLAIASIDLSTPMKDHENPFIRGPLIHIKLISAQNSAIHVILVTAEETEQSGKREYQSDVNMFELHKNAMKSTKRIDESLIDSRKMTARFITHVRMSKRLITCLWQYENELLVGFDNGHVEFRDCSTLDVLTNIVYTGHGRLPTPSVWGVRSRRGDGLAEFTVSPNGSVLLCVRSSGRLDFVDIADTQMLDHLSTFEEELFGNLLTLSILNNTDHTDLENIITQLARHSNKHGKELIGLILENTFSKIEGIFPHDSRSSESSELLRRLFGVQLSLFKTYEGEGIQYLNTLAYMQLDTVEAAFRNSSKNLHDTPVFSQDSLLSLLHLTSWVVDFSVNLVKNIYVHYFTIKQGGSSAAEKSHLCLFYNTKSRTLLKNVLNYVSQFRRYIDNLAGNNSLGVEKIHDMKSFLDEDVFKKRCPFKLEDFDEYVKDASLAVEKAMKDLPDLRRTEYKVILQCLAPDKLRNNLSELEIIFKQFVRKFNPNVVYFYEDDWVKSVDVVRKTRRMPLDRRCIRCGCYSSTHDYINSRWSRNYVRSCVCGGHWKKLNTPSK